MRALVVVLALVAGAAPAAAQDKAAAEAAFREARRLMAAKQYAAACPKFEASLRLDPATGTLLNLADCYARQGRTASAWARFVEVAQRDGNTARAREARRRAAALEPRLVRLRITAVDPPSDLRVTRDDVDVASLLGVAVPVDPGLHAVAAGSAGRMWSSEVAAEREGETVSVDLPPFWREVRAEPASPPPAAAPPMVPPPEIVENDGGSRRTVALVVGAAGLTTVAVGLVFGAMARSDWNDSRAGCDEMNHCDDAAYAQVERAQRSATLSTVLVGAGAAAIVTGGVLWLTAPRAGGRRVGAAPVVGPGTAVFTVTGSF